MRLLSRLLHLRALKNYISHSDLYANPLRAVIGQKDPVVSWYTPGLFHASSTIYLQDCLACLPDRCNLKAICASGAIPPRGWDGIHGDYALVDSQKRLYGVVSKKELAEAGYQTGDIIACHVGRPPKSGTYAILEFEPSIEAQNRINRTLIVNVSEPNFSNKIPEHASVTLSTLPVSKGSKAKPHIAISDESGVQIAEVGARSEKYQDLVTRIGQKAEGFFSIRKNSYGSKYLHCVILFAD